MINASSQTIAIAKLWIALSCVCGCVGRIGDGAPLRAPARDAGEPRTTCTERPLIVSETGATVDGTGALAAAPELGTCAADGGGIDAAAAMPMIIGDPDGVTAVAASDFLDTLGVNTHVGQGVDDAGAVATALAYSGLRLFRDDGRAGALEGYLAIHRASGARAALLASQDIPSVLAVATRLQAEGGLLAIEGPNEPNNFAVRYEGQASNTMSFVPVAHFQRDLYAAVKAEPTLAGIPVFHASEAGGSEPDDVGLQYLTIPAGANSLMPAGTRYADYANTHNYVCGHRAKLVDNAAWQASDRTLDGDWDGLYVEYGRTWAKGFPGYANDQLTTLPWVSTETGWLTRGDGSITEEQQGRVLLNVYLAAFKRGVAYTFVYMLRDDPIQGYWGMFDTDYQPKPAGSYLHNLTSLIADTKKRAPGKLDYALIDPPPTAHDLLLQKSDGSFALVVWNERADAGADDVVVDLRSTRSRVVIYDPVQAPAAPRTLSSVSTLTLTLTDHPVVLLLL